MFVLCRIRALRMDGSVISEELKAWDEQYHRIRRLTPLARKVVNHSMSIYSIHIRWMIHTSLPNTFPLAGPSQELAWQIGLPSGAE